MSFDGVKSDLLPTQTQSYLVFRGVALNSNTDVTIITPYD